VDAVLQTSWLINTSSIAPNVMLNNAPIFYDFIVGGSKDGDPCTPGLLPDCEVIVLTEQWPKVFIASE
jgi:hypothetical protein